MNLKIGKDVGQLPNTRAACIIFQASSVSPAHAVLGPAPICVPSSWLLISGPAVLCARHRTAKANSSGVSVLSLHPVHGSVPCSTLMPFPFLCPFDAAASWFAQDWSRDWVSGAGK